MLTIPMTCFQCAEDLARRDPRYVLAAISAAPMEWNEENWYEFRCPNDHISYFRVQLLRFQILFEMGLQALAKGFLREAVMSMYSALEDLSRTYCLVYAQASGLSTERVDELRRALRLSERRTGAFELALALSGSRGVSDFKRQSPDWRSLRNSIIHEGAFPGQSRAAQCCEQIYEFMSLITREMVREYPDIVEGLVVANLADNRRHYVDVLVATMAPSSAVRLDASTDGTTPFAEVLKQAEMWSEQQENLRVLSQLALNDLLG